jgi:hypothetical protein
MHTMRRVSQGPPKQRIDAPLAQAALHLLIGCAADEQVELANARVAHLNLSSSMHTVSAAEKRRAASRCARACVLSRAFPYDTLTFKSLVARMLS